MALDGLFHEVGERLARGLFLPSPYKVMIDLLQNPHSIRWEVQGQVGQWHFGKRWPSGALHGCRSSLPSRRRRVAQPM
jgi:hypothetical protein